MKYLSFTISTIALFIVSISSIYGAVVWTEPAFPSQLDNITLYFDASEGNGALAGFTGDVYAHTGVITNASSSPTDWKHVQGNWGTIDNQVLMTYEGNDVYSISYNIEDFYGIPPGEVVEKLAFVFRNADGSIVGRDTDGSDIYLDVYPSNTGLLVNMISLQNNNTILYLGEDLLINILVNKVAQIEIKNDGNLIFSENTDEVDFTIQANSLGAHVLDITVSEGLDTSFIQRAYFVLDTNEPTINAPPNTKSGLNYYSDTSYIFSLVAPLKNNVFLLCPANDYEIDIQYQLNKANDHATFWIELPRHLFANGNNTYQYLVDGYIKIADPYATVVLDPWNDGDVPSDVLAELPPYPTDYTTGIVTAFDFEKTEYDWEVTDFEKPEKSNLVIYEILMRDFLEDHNYKSLLDTLEYLERLGVNAIELMPIQEFEGNNSWGYNPSFHMAVDKYYGSRDQLKAVIDAAHEKGIAVILDVVFNHAFSQSPLCQMYWNATEFRPAADNPWLNETPRHPFNVGYDFNHVSPYTKFWVKHILRHWIEEYHFDGFRFDLSKGFTQLNSGNNGDLMAQYDLSRINILKDYANFVWSLDENSFVILEHFAANNEEKELSEHGMMLWSNTTHQFAEAAMSYNSNLSGADYTNRGWADPHLIAYMESHDEERMSYKVETWGNGNSSYNTKDFDTLVERVAGTHAIYLSIPGPKMLWQFGELAYDFSINRCEDGTISDDCRLSPKPIRWDYFNDHYARRGLYDKVSAMLYLRTNFPTFTTTDFSFDDSDSFVKSVHLNHQDMDAVTLANFAITPATINPDFQYTGTWYEYFTGAELDVTDTQAELSFNPGEYRIYTSQKVTPPNGYFPITATEEVDLAEIKVTPVVVQQGDVIQIQLPQNLNVNQIEMYNVQGILTGIDFIEAGDQLEFSVPSVANGLYFISLKTQGQFFTKRIVIQN